MARIQTREFGVRAADLESQRAALIEFAAEMYRPLVRCDQRAKGEQYVRGLLLEGRRKSIQPMAARLPDGDEQGLQQFITDSPWEDGPVRRRLAVRMSREIDPDGWVVDDTGLPKDGRFSPGVAHQYCGRWARRLTVRCWSRSTPRVVGRRVHLSGGCSCRSPGIRITSGAGGRGSRGTSGIARNGSWRSTSSISCWSGDWSVAWYRQTAVTAISPRSGWGSRSASFSTWCRSRASPRRSQLTPPRSHRPTKDAVVRRPRATRTSPSASRTSCCPPGSVGGTV